MADPESNCTNCDRICITPYNPDEECFGRMTAEERAAYYDYLSALYSDTENRPVNPCEENQTA